LTSADVHALGLGALGQGVAHAGLEAHGQLKRGALAVELAALGLAEVVLALHRFIVITFAGPGRSRMLALVRGDFARRRLLQLIKRGDTPSKVTYRSTMDHKRTG
jgi:hypothetical protein